METSEPGERLPMPRRRLVGAYLLAVSLPPALAAAMIPLRADHGQTLAMVLVVPVVAIALLGATGPAVVAALSAGLAYDVFLTEPYYRLAIDDSDDIVTAAILVAVGLTVGVLSSRVARYSTRAATRRAELLHVVQFLDATGQPLPPDELARTACGHITELLGLRDCRWSRGHRDTHAPLLLPDGNVMGYVTDLNPDRAKLPARLELAAMSGTTELGRFVLEARADRVVSYEERLVAATIASLFAAALSQLEPTGPADQDGR